MIKQWYVRKNGKFVKPQEVVPDNRGSLLLPKAPSEAETDLILAQLNDAISAAERIVRRMDTNHALLQDCIREVREAREIVAESNLQSKRRAGAQTA